MRFSRALQLVRLGDKRFLQRKDPAMSLTTRRAIIRGALCVGVAGAMAGCTSGSVPLSEAHSWQSEQFGKPYTRQEVEYRTKEKPGTIIVNPKKHYLYLVQSGGRALRYEVGVGAAGYGWSGEATVGAKREWPDWHPTTDYIDEHPGVAPALTKLDVGKGMVAGPNNPLGARALYLWQGNKDTLYRIHGTNEPWTIGKNVSAGCIRLTNSDIIDLYARTPIGTKVIVLPSGRG